jgi:amino acid transporter
VPDEAETDKRVSSPANAAEPPEGRRTMTLREATVLGIGSMIGAGIFALPGEAGAVAVVLAFFAVDTVRHDPWAFVAIVAIGLAAVVLDAVFRDTRATTAAG